MIVLCFPDSGSGSGLNVSSKALANRVGAKIDQTSRQQVRLPNGAMAKTIGTVSLNFSFSGDDGAH
jgi:hypothetical protein